MTVGKSSTNGSAKTVAHSLNNSGWKASGPEDLSGLSCSFFMTTDTPKSRSVSFQFKSLPMTVEFYLYSTVITALIHLNKPELIRYDWIEYGLRSNWVITWCAATLGVLLHITKHLLINKYNINILTTRRWYVTISCQPDWRPPQPVRPAGDGLWPLPRHVSWRSRKVAAFARGRAVIYRMEIKHVPGYSPMSGQIWKKKQ